MYIHKLTVIWLNEAMDARFTIPIHASEVTLASQVTMPSMVAMLGWIMPLPCGWQLTVVMWASKNTDVCVAVYS